MGLFKWLTETPDARHKRQAAERKERSRERHTAGSTGHPDDWGPGYGVNWDWGKGTGKGKRK